MVAVVKDEGAAAALGLVDAPHPGAQGHLPFSVTLAGANVEADHLRLANLAGIDHFFGANMRAVKNEILENSEFDTRSLGCLDHAVSFRYSKGHRFLHRDVLAGLAGSNGHVGVKMMGHKEFHQIYIRLGQELLVV